ncbi:cell growth-regulating nucleolar protein [Blastomyces parvus]|uniref:Cell growth-regulating nucleolar protein n=1 Tax=Blastomyces parvus TaxID=2060905 RepID=A0A2B7X1X1_9EURO|nr:cell growth-regulating nucleolar protein [Blastomyces parvus]
MLHQTTYPHPDYHASRKHRNTRSVTIVEPPNSSNSPRPPDPWVEDAPDVDEIRPAHNAAPPSAPSPPQTAPRQEPGNVSTPATTTKPNANVNVFDFLDTTATPNASKVSLGGSDAPMVMLKDAPPLFNAPRELAKLDNGKDDEVNYDVAFEENGFSYGADTLEGPLYQHGGANGSTASFNNFMTPAPKRSKDRTSRRDRDQDQDRDRDRDRAASPDQFHTPHNNLTSSTGDKKRKRGHAGKVDGQAANSASNGGDDIQMIDVPPTSGTLVNPSTPTLTHSGLTGGINRMMRDISPPTPDEAYRSADEGVNGGGRHQYPDPTSPIKRTRMADNDASHNHNHSHTNNDNNDNKDDYAINETDKALALAIQARTGRVLDLLRKTKGPVFANPIRSSRAEPVLPPAQAAHREKKRKAVTKRSGTVTATGVSKATRATTSARAGSSGSKKADAAAAGTAPRRLKAIEYRPDSSHGTSTNGGAATTSNQLVVYGGGSSSRRAEDEDAGERELVLREQASVFLSLVTKGPESGRGFSVHKALKRFHREGGWGGSSEGDGEAGRERDSVRGKGKEKERDREREREKEKERGRGRGRGKEGRESRERERERGKERERERRNEVERELWRVLRLKRNERGEIVVFV